MRQIDSASSSQVADYSAEDHTFPVPTRALMIQAAAATTLVVRLVDDAEDLALSVGAGHYFLPLQVIHIRMVGSTAACRSSGCSRPMAIMIGIWLRYLGRGAGSGTPPVMMGGGDFDPADFDSADFDTGS